MPELISQHVQAIRMFKDLEPAVLNQLAQRLNPKVYKASQVIVSQSDVSAEVMVLCSGLARVRIDTPAGRPVLLRDIGPGEIFGDWAALDGKGRAATVVALTDSVVGIMRQDDFVQLVTTHPTLALRQMQELIRHLRTMNDRLVQFMLLKANLRVQKVLVDLAQPTPQGLLIAPLPVHSEIAMRAYTQREVVARELTRLQSEGHAVKQGDGLMLINPQDLECFAEL